jgi:outer membrane lipopolysaccharide assembly protein LptE/RlpB
MKQKLLFLATTALLGLQLTLAGCGFHHRHHGSCAKPCCCKCVAECPKMQPAPEK